METPLPKNNPLPKKTLYIIIGGVVVLALIGGISSFFLKKGVEKVTEKVVENSLGKDAAVKITNDTYTVNTNGGSVQVGEDLKLPSGFPSDVYVVSGDIKGAFSTAENKGYTVTLETTKTPSEVNALYEKEIVADGWTVTGSSTYSNVYSIMGEKGDRIISVTTSDSDGKTSVILSTSTSN